MKDAFGAQDWNYPSPGVMEDFSFRSDYKNYDNYLSKYSSGYDHKTSYTYKGHYTPGKGGYTNPELLKTLGLNF